MFKQGTVGGSHATVKDQVVELFVDLKHQLIHEGRKPQESAQIDEHAKSRVTGLAITLFALIALLLAAAILGILVVSHRG